MRGDRSMNDMENIFQYKYDVNELDAIIQKRSKGIVSIIPAAVEEEVKLREKEHALIINNIFEEEDVKEALSDEETQKLLKKHKALVEREIEKERRKAHEDEFITIEISEEERNAVRELCATSYVRKLPNSDYHTNESEMYDSIERKSIMKRVNAIGNMYYNVEDWRNAMKTLLEAWKFAKDHDYPGIPENLKEGHIRLNRQMPKLMLGYKTIVTDHEMLRGILNGEIECVDKDQTAYTKKKRPKDSEVEGIPLNKIGRVMDNIEMEYETQLARMGNNDSMILAANRVRNTVYNRFSADNLLYKSKDKINKNRYDENGFIKTFDFTQPGSGKKAWEEVSGKKPPTVTDFAKDIEKANKDGGVVNVLSASVFNDFSHAMRGHNYTFNKYTTVPVNPQINQDPNVIAQEKALLETMRMYNPSLL